MENDLLRRRIENCFGVKRAAPYCQHICVGEREEARLPVDAPHLRQVHSMQQRDFDADPSSHDGGEQLLIATEELGIQPRQEGGSARIIKHDRFDDTRRMMTEMTRENAHGTEERVRQLACVHVADAVAQKKVDSTAVFDGCGVVEEAPHHID